MKSTETIVGLFGAQHPHAERHLRTLTNLQEVDGIVLWDPDADSLERLRQHRPCKVRLASPDLTAVLTRGDLSFCIAGIRHDQSAELFRTIICAGIPLLAEKPGGRSAAELREIVKEAECRRCPFGVLYTNRYHPAVVKARELIRSGILGPLMLAEMRMTTSQLQFRDPNSWIHKQAAAGGGVLGWLGGHYLDLLSYIPGDPIVSVQAEVALRGGNSVDVEDVAVLAVRFQSGAIGSFACGYTSKAAGSGYEQSQIDSAFAFHGRDGVLTRPNVWKVSVETAHPDWAGQPSRDFVFERSNSDSYGGTFGEAFVRDFLSSTRLGIPPPVSAREALRILETIEAAYKSSRSGCRVALPLPVK